MSCSWPGGNPPRSLRRRNGVDSGSGLVGRQAEPQATIAGPGRGYAGRGAGRRVGPAMFHVEHRPLHRRRPVGFDWGLLTRPRRVEGEHEVDGADEHHIQLLESGEDSAIALQPAKQTLDLVASLVHLSVVLPRVRPGLEPERLVDCLEMCRYQDRPAALPGRCFGCRRQPSARRAPQDRPAALPAVDLFGLVRRIRERRDAGIFIDLKMAGDVSTRSATRSDEMLG